MLTFVGCAINMLAVPALALAGSWPIAACFIAAERTGRAIRRPIVQGMLSHARDEIGAGRAFGINESLDALGATLGPLLVALALARTGNYRLAFALLLGSALLCVAMLVLARRRYSNPRAFETSKAASNTLPASYWWYVAAGALIGFGFVDFVLGDWYDRFGFPAARRAHSRSAVYTVSVFRAFRVRVVRHGLWV